MNLNQNESSATRDEKVVAAQLGRDPQGKPETVRRCSLDLPMVVRVPPVVDGKPFPTRYWLTCPAAGRRASRLEANGAVRELSELARQDESFRDALLAAHRAYAEERDALIPEDALLRPRGGVAGIEGDGVKCLHAHLAHFWSGAANPVGAEAAIRIGEVECLRPCVIAKEDVFERNSGWREALNDK